MILNVRFLRHLSFKTIKTLAFPRFHFGTDGKKTEPQDKTNEKLEPTTIEITKAEYENMKKFL